jgi:hypothetical protein
MSAKDHHRFVEAAERHAKQKVAHLNREPSASEEKAALEETFFAWLDARRYDQLTAFLHQEYGSLGPPNYFEFVRELGRDLAQRNDMKRLHALFRGILPGCYRDFWMEWKHAEQGLLGNIANAAEKKAELMRLLFEYFRSMHLLGCQVAAEKIRADILLLSQNKRRKVVAKDWTAETLETTHRKSPTRR